MSQSYLSSLLREVQVDKESALWLKGLFVSAKVMSMQESLSKQDSRKTKTIYSKIKQNRRLRKRSRNKQMIARSIREDNKQLDELLEELAINEDKHSSEIEKEIAKLEKELEENTGEMKPLVEQLRESVEREDGESAGVHRNFMTNISEYS